MAGFRPAPYERLRSGIVRKTIVTLLPVLACGLVPEDAVARPGRTDAASKAARAKEASMETDEADREGLRQAHRDMIEAMLARDVARLASGTVASTY